MHGPDLGHRLHPLLSPSHIVAMTVRVCMKTCLCLNRARCRSHASMSAPPPPSYIQAGILIDKYATGASTCPPALLSLMSRSPTQTYYASIHMLVLVSSCPPVLPSESWSCSQNAVRAKAVNWMHCRPGDSPCNSASIPQLPRVAPLYCNPNIFEPPHARAARDLGYRAGTAPDELDASKTFFCPSNGTSLKTSVPPEFNKTARNHTPFSTQFLHT